MGFAPPDATGLQLFDFILRLFVLPLVAATIWITVDARQNNTDYGELGLDNLPGLKYMVCVSAASGGYSLFAALCSCLSWLLTKAWLFFVAYQYVFVYGLVKQILAYLMVTSVSAQGEFLYLVYNGDQMVSWSEACNSYGKFCTRLRIALAMHVMAASCFLVLSVVSAYRVFRSFDPPFAPSNEGEQDRT